MGTTKISDVTSFFNMAPGGVDMPGKAEAGRDLFAQAMSDAAGKGAGNTAAGTESRTFKQIAPGDIAKQIKKTDTAKAKAPEETPKDDVNTAGAGKSDGKAKAVKKAEGIADKVKDAVKDELSVDDSQLEEAMSALGLTAADLLDPDNIKSLMLELSGEQDPMVLITNEGLLNSIGNVTGLLENSLGELADELGITDEQLAGLLNDIEDFGAGSEAALGTADENALPGNAVKMGPDAPLTGSEETAGTGDGSLAAQASIQRKEASQSKDGQAESGMQNAMQPQEMQQPAVNEAAVPETEYRSVYADREEILRQVTDNIRLNINGDTTTMELQLHPASLGTVNLQIASNNGVITANLQVQNETVKSALEAQLVQLLETFEEQGQKVEAIEVTVAGYDLDRGPDQGTGSQDGERKENDTPVTGRTARRRINLNDLNEDDIEEMTEEEQLAAEMMAMNGGNVDYMA